LFEFCVDIDIIKEICTMVFYTSIGEAYMTSELKPSKS